MVMIIGAFAGYSGIYAHAGDTKLYTMSWSNPNIKVNTFVHSVPIAYVYFSYRYVSCVNRQLAFSDNQYIVLFRTC
jgi:hypothetical protein